MVEAKQTARLSNNVDKQIQCTFTDRLVSYNSAFCNLRCFVCSNARISFPWNNLKLIQGVVIFVCLFVPNSERTMRANRALKSVIKLKLISTSSCYFLELDENASDDKEEVYNVHLCTCILLVRNSLILEYRSFTRGC